MKRIMTSIWLLTACVSYIALFSSCKQTTKSNDLLAVKMPSAEKKAAVPLTQEFKDYWYAGKAEISSYQLKQARYGETREGNAVLIYVTEDFLPDAQVKADNQNESNVPVLKLNATKKFNTGNYP